MPLTGDAASSRLPRLGIVIPARNEAPRIAAVLDAIPERFDGIGERIVIVVDDGSIDDTYRVARAPGVQALRHIVNLGKGAALTTGCLAAILEGCDIIALMDADGQHVGTDLMRLLEPIRREQADLSIGVRRLGGQMPMPNRLGNWALTNAFRVLFGLRLADTQSGLRAFRASVYPTIAWQATDYSVETEMLVRATRAHLRLSEVEIGTVYHDAYKGTTMADGVKIFGDMLRYAISR